MDWLAWSFASLGLLGLVWLAVLWRQDTKDAQRWDQAKREREAGEWLQREAEESDRRLRERGAVDGVLDRHTRPD